MLHKEPFVSIFDEFEDTKNRPTNVQLDQQESTEEQKDWVENIVKVTGLSKSEVQRNLKQGFQLCGSSTEATTTLNNDNQGAIRKRAIWTAAEELKLLEFVH